IPLDVPVAAVEPILEDIGHGDQLDRAALYRHSIAGCTAATATTANQGDLNRVVFGGMDMRDHRGCQGRSGGDAPSILQEIPAGNRILARKLHGWAPSEG